MKKIIISLLVLIVSAAYLSSCHSDEKHGRAPMFANIELKPNSLKAGDSLTVNIAYADRGEYYVNAPFSISLSRNDLSISVFSQKFNSENLPEFLKCQVPDSLPSGTYNVSLKCGSVSLTADAENGTIYAAGNEVAAKLRVE